MKLKRILVHVPEKFLERFDREIEGVYASRNKAIRAGMIMVLENVKRTEITVGEKAHDTMSRVNGIERRKA
jgi:metal-responsive CopG/Arc/MetJ family transcriptional regulator